MTVYKKDIKHGDVPLLIDFSFKEVSRQMVAHLFMDATEHRKMIERSLEEALSSNYLQECISKFVNRILNEEIQNYFDVEQLRIGFAIREKISKELQDYLFPEKE
jgi:hypothetical protein